MSTHLIAIDWSGRRDPSGQRQHIWMARCNESKSDIILTNGKTREEVIDEVITLSSSADGITVGFDFAFALPAWYMAELSCESALALWQHTAERVDNWLGNCPPPFWGRPGKKRPSGHREPDWRGHRRTELSVQAERGHLPKSPFQIGGAGAVGTGSLRGMPLLAKLQENGFAIWPFNDSSSKTVIEIYPRISVGREIKVSVRSDRERHLEHAKFKGISDESKSAAIESEDAFDALCALMDMIEHRESLAHLPPARDSIDRLEGRIWIPGEL